MWSRVNPAKEIQMKKILIITLLALASTFVWAQIDLPRPDLNPFRATQNSLFSPDKMKISHSMGFEASSSSSGHGYYLSRYTNHIKYQFNPKLQMQLDLNFVNYGSANTSRSIELNDDNKNKVIPEFSLSYKPSDNVRIDFRFEQARSPEYYNRHWYRDW